MAELILRAGFMFYLERLKLLTAVNSKLNLLLLNVVVPWFIQAYITLFVNPKEALKLFQLLASTVEGFALAVKLMQTPD